MITKTGPVQAGPVSLYVEEQGAGEPLLLIQGLGYATWAWRYQTPELAKRFRVIAFDNRGTGRSEKPPGPYSIEEMADDAAAVLDSRGAGAAHVLRMSMGGYIAQLLALRQPGLVRSLVLLVTGPGGPGTLPVPEATREVWIASASLPPPEFARATMPLSFRPGWADAHPEQFEQLLAARLEFPTPGECWAAQYGACERFYADGPPVERISVPTLVVHGTADRIVPYENGVALAGRIPGARLVTFEGAGHLAALEEPERLNREVAEFLESV